MLLNTNKRRKYRYTIIYKVHKKRVEFCILKKDEYCTSEKNAYTCHKIGKMIECLQYEETYGWREENGYTN